jgi:hypothetical protein
MDDAVRVRVLDTFADLDCQIELARQAHPLRTRQTLLQIFPIQIFHGEVRLALVLAQVVDGHDVFVRQVPGGASLSEEALPQLRIELLRSQYELERHDPLEDGVERAVDDAHAALSELFLELIPAERLHWGTQTYSFGGQRSTRLWMGSGDVFRAIRRAKTGTIQANGGRPAAVK